MMFFIKNFRYTNERSYKTNRLSKLVVIMSTSKTEKPCSISDSGRGSFFIEKCHPSDETLASASPSCLCHVQARWRSADHEKGWLHNISD